MKRLSAFILISLLAACARNTVPVATITTMVPTQADADRAATKFPGTSLEQLTKGHKLYVDNCGECHRHFRPNAFPETKWRKEVPPMAKKAKMTEGQEELVLKYVVTMSEATLNK